jgi:hypothetical protein
VNLSPKRIGASGSGTILQDRNTRRYRNTIAKDAANRGSYGWGDGAKSARLMAWGGRISPSFIGSGRTYRGDLYAPDTGKINAYGRRVGRTGFRVQERSYQSDKPTGNVYNYRISNNYASRPLGAATVRRRLPNR